MRERSEAHVGLCKALASKDCDPQEAVAREALADLIVSDLEMSRVLDLSNRLLVDRDLATPLDVIFDIESLREAYGCSGHGGVTRAEMVMAARLCGAQNVEIRGNYRWADSDEARFVLDVDTIKVRE